MTCNLAISAEVHKHEEDGGEAHEVLKQELSELEGHWQGAAASDDVTGAKLNTGLVRKARKLEI